MYLGWLLWGEEAALLCSATQAVPAMHLGWLLGRGKRPPGRRRTQGLVVGEGEEATWKVADLVRGVYMMQASLSRSRAPLYGVRVLEFTHAVLGPACGLMLADFGAEVIRIERTPKGDPTRYLPGFGKGYYPMFNRNKRSLPVDLKTEGGQQIVHKLLETADVLIENFAPGTMARLGLGYDALTSQYPQLIYCSLKGFMPGPYENRMALDEVVQMMSGLAYMTGRPGDPLRAGASVVDIMAGMYGAMGVLLALQQRAKGENGMVVHSSLFETAAFLMGHHMAYAAQVDEPVPPMPARVSAWAVYHQFDTKDDQRVFVGVTSDKQWCRFCEAFEQPAWAEGPAIAD